MQENRKINKIKEIIKDEDFYLSNLTKIYRKVSKELMTGAGECDYKALAKKGKIKMKSMNLFGTK